MKEHLSDFKRILKLLDSPPPTKFHRRQNHISVSFVRSIKPCQVKSRCQMEVIKIIPLIPSKRVKRLVAATIGVDSDEVAITDGNGLPVPESSSPPAIAKAIPKPKWGRR